MRKFVALNLSWVELLANTCLLNGKIGYDGSEDSTANVCYKDNVIKGPAALKLSKSISLFFQV